jgi:hypothetical protein
MRRTLGASCILTAICLVITASAAARGWTLSVKPSTVTRGGTLRIRTTSRARTCRLTFHIGSSNYRFRIRGHGSDFTMATNSDLGRARVSVRCKGVVRTKRFTIIQRKATQPSSAPGASAPPPSASPPASAPHTTPVTVYNVCHLDPGLGPYQSISATYQGMPAPSAVWVNSAGRITMFASSIDGDNAVDVAVIPTADHTAIAYFARCNWTDWVSMSQWLAQHPSVTSEQAASWQYLGGIMPIEPLNLDNTWTQPSAGWIQCEDPGAYDPGTLCNYYP